MRSIFARSKKEEKSSWARAFVVTLFFVTVACGLFYLDFFRTYSAETTILVIGKGERSESASEMAENLSEIASTLSFYDRLIKDSEGIVDAFSGFSPDQRKRNFQKIFSATHVPKSGVIVLTASSDDAESAKRLSQAGTETLLSLSGFYYNIKTEADLRILEGPIVKASVANPFGFGLISLFSAFVVTSLFFLILRFLPSLFEKKRGVSVNHKAFSEGESVPWIDPRKFVPVKPENLLFEGEEASEETHPVPSVKASAPSNLPVASEGNNLPFATEDLPFSFEEPKQTKEEETASLPLVPENAETLPKNETEPSVEEYKRRLNELLSGGK